MSRLLLFSFLFVSSNISAQFWLTSEEEYLLVGTGLDARNAIIGGTVNPASYDGTFSFGYRNGGFSIIGYYENFTGIRFQMLSLNPGFVIRPGKKLIPVIDASLAVIKRPWKAYPSVAINSRLEYHFPRFFLYGRGEYRWRTDYNFYQFSVYVGVAYKFGFED